MGEKGWKYAIEPKTNRVDELLTEFRRLSQIQEYDQFRRNAMVALVVMLGVVVGVTWYHAVTFYLYEVIKVPPFNPRQIIFYNFSAAIAITLICSLGIFIITRWGSKK